MFCFNEFAFTVQVKHKQYINSRLHFDMFVFYDWPFHTFCTKNVGSIIFRFNSWLSFQQLCHLLWVHLYHFHSDDSNRGSSNSVISVHSWHDLQDARNCLV